MAECAESSKDIQRRLWSEFPENDEKISGEEMNEEPIANKEGNDDEAETLTKSKIGKGPKTPGVVYLSRIPPFMKPIKVRQLLSEYGEVGRVFLQPEG